MNKLDQKLTRLTQDLHDVLEESARPISSEVSELKARMETRLDNMEIKLARLEAAVQSIGETLKYQFEQHREETAEGFRQVQQRIRKPG